MFDFLIVGAGLFGATCARLLKDAEKRVLVVEKRSHIAGNAYTEEIEGIQVHRYGAHIFHTNDDEVWEFVSRFAEFNRFTNSPLANYHGSLFPLPFNMGTFYQLWGVTTPKEAEAKLATQREPIYEPKNLEEHALSLVGRDIYEKLIKGYTEKQWGRNCKELPASIIQRLPVRLTFDNNYFDAKYQGIPVGGYTQMVANMLSGIDVWLEVDYLKNRDDLDRLTDRVIYTGPIDAYFDFRYGPLEYRGLRFETETISTPNYQGNAVINFTDLETPWTRIVEHKWFTFGKDIHGKDIPITVVSREYPNEWKQGDEQFYPINDTKNTAIYKRYKALANRNFKVIFGGRLGLYRYLDMDQTIREALTLVSQLNI